MGHYLVQVAYRPDAWAAMVKNPQDMTEAGKAMKKAGKASYQAPG